MCTELKEKPPIQIPRSEMELREREQMGEPIYLYRKIKKVRNKANALINEMRFTIGETMEFPKFQADTSHAVNVACKKMEEKIVDSITREDSSARSFVQYMLHGGR